MRRPRHLSPEERALWDQVARRTDPLRHDRPKPPEGPLPAPRKPELPKKVQLRLGPAPFFQVGEKADHRRDHDLMAGLSESLAAAPVSMDRKIHGKMKRGKLHPEDRLDLHGMTLAEAHPALVSFVLSAQQSGKRLVLVITGKGKHRDEGGPIPTRPGALRHQVPQWLSLPPLAQAVLQVGEAHVSHGGRGALYVYLRRRRQAPARSERPA